MLILMLLEGKDCFISLSLVFFFLLFLVFIGVVGVFFLFVFLSRFFSHLHPFFFLFLEVALSSLISNLLTMTEIMKKTLDFISTWIIAPLLSI